MNVRTKWMLDNYEYKNLLVLILIFFIDFKRYKT